QYQAAARDGPTRSRLVLDRRPSAGRDGELQLLAADRDDGVALARRAVEHDHQRAVRILECHRVPAARSHDAGTWVDELREVADDVVGLRLVDLSVTDREQRI